MTGTAGFARHARQVVLPEVGVAGQAALRDSSALIVGLGGLGSPVALYLATAGVGRLVLADFDRVSASNLQRQVLYGERDLGRRKTEAAAERLRAIDTQLVIETVDAAPIATAGETATGAAASALGDNLRAAVASADVVLDCTDNFPSRFALNAACVAARKPLVSGAAIRFEGQVAAFNLRRGGPCYACLYPEAGPTAEACEDAGVLGPVVGVIGSMQALLALHLLLGHADVAGTLHRWDARRLSWRSLTLARDPACPVCSERSSK